MTLPWARHLWREVQRNRARDHLAALDAASLGSASKYGGESAQAFRKRASELQKIIESKD